MKTTLRLVLVGTASACALAAWAMAATGTGATAATTPRSAATITTAAPTTSSSSTTTSSTTTSTTTTTVPGTGQLWTGARLTVTPASVGAVRVGMSLDEGSRAAGETIIEVGD